MLDVFGALHSRLLRRSPVSIDSAAFKLHYRITFVILLTFSILVTSRQYIGDPIDCMLNTAGPIPPNVLDQYCWISTTFSVPGAFHKRVGHEVPHPGIDKHTPGEERKYHQYYQWVCFVLFAQAVVFCLPHYLWKCWEAGRLKDLATGLNPLLEDSDSNASKKKVVVKYFLDRRNSHNYYYARYLFCVILNFINAVGQIYFTNRFLGGEFLSYGLEVIGYSELEDQESRLDPMIRVFPRVTKCSFHTVGASGDIQRHDAICVLPINIINEKIYIFLWFWLVLLCVVSGLDVLYRLCAAVSPKLRHILLRIQTRFADQHYLQSVSHQYKVGDWFVLYQLGKSVEAGVFSDLIVDLAKGINGKEGNSIV